MKTKIMIEIETPDAKDLTITSEEGKSASECEPEELKACREQFAEDLPEGIVKHIKNYFKDSFEDQFIEEMEELYVEGWDDLEAYGIKITLQKNKEKLWTKYSNFESLSKVFDNRIKELEVLTKNKDLFKNITISDRMELMREVEEIGLKLNDLISAIPEALKNN